MILSGYQIFSYSNMCGVSNHEELYLDSADADACLRHLFNGSGKEERDSKADGRVQRHGHKHTAGGDCVSHQHIHSECHKFNYLACGKKGSHVKTTQVGAAHDFRYFFPIKRKKHHKGMKHTQVNSTII